MRTCFLSIDVEPFSARSDQSSKDDKDFEGVEKLANLLDVFKKYKANATLFITGEVLGKYPNLVRKWAENYEIGSHGYYHNTLNLLNFEARERQIRDFVELYQSIFKTRPKGFRAPRNIIDNEQFPILEKYGFLYDSSVFSRYPWPIQKYEGYNGRAPIFPYHPDKDNYRKRGDMKLLEIPEAPITFWGLPVLNIPLVATWVRKLGVRVFKIILFFRKPKYINFNMHSWDGVRFEGKSSKNSGEPFLKQLDVMLGFLKRIGYEFKNGKQIYEELAKNRKQR